MQDYLSPEGKAIYKKILAHVHANGWSQDIDTFELSMLANSFDLYSKCAAYVKKNGPTQIANSKFAAARPECSIMAKEYQNILKHGGKFGLNPSDRRRLFKIAGPPKELDAFDLL